MKRIIKRIIVVIICAAVLVTAVVLYRNYKNEKIVTLTQYEDDIGELIRIKQYDEAVKLCVTALKDYDNEASLYILKAQAYKDNGESDKYVGTLEYGYKQTNDEKIKKMLDSVKSENGDESYYSPDYNYTDESGNSGGADITDNGKPLQRDDYGEFTNTSIPEVSVPDVSIPEESSSVADTSVSANSDDTITTEE